MDKLLELEKKLREARTMLEKNSVIPMHGLNIEKKKTSTRKDGTSATTYHVKDANGKHISTHVIGHEGTHSMQAHDPSYKHKLEGIHEKVELHHGNSGLRNDYSQHLGKSLDERIDDLLKNSMMGYDTVNGSFAQSEEHDDEKEDKRLIAVAIDTHNEKKHDEDKDKDSAYKDLKIKKDEGDAIKMEEVSFAKNGQWSLDKGLGSKLDNAEHKAKISQALGSIRQPAKVTNAAGETKMVSPAEQVSEQKSVKASKASEAKAKAEAEAAERRASYKKP